MSEEVTAGEHNDELIDIDELLGQWKEEEAKRKDEAVASGKIALDEERDTAIIESWYGEAQKCDSIAQAAGFASRLMSDYYHDYGTICHAIAAGGVAMANGMNGESSGITGFQAGAVGWMLHSKWSLWQNEPRTITDWSKLLYPQYDQEFNEINQTTKDWLINRAKELLADDARHAHPAVLSRWQELAEGTFPAFVERMVVRP